MLSGTGVDAAVRLDRRAVTDTGGILCHAAVVAREYGLPAVVGAEIATAFIPDGALVRVDGATGEVHALRSP